MKSPTTCHPGVAPFILASRRVDLSLPHAGSSSTAIFAPDNPLSGALTCSLLYMANSYSYFMGHITGEAASSPTCPEHPVTSAVPVPQDLTYGSCSHQKRTSKEQWLPCIASYPQN